MKDLSEEKLSIVGSVGVPASYGGFETLVENLLPLPMQVRVFCSGKYYRERIEKYKGASLTYLPLDGNGAQSVIYDALSMFRAGLYGSKRCLVLGISGAICFPIIRLFFPNMKIAVNLDGIEWRRDKWQGLARSFLRFSERMAVKYADAIIADNKGIQLYLRNTYSRGSILIEYGGDHSVQNIDCDVEPGGYALAICRIEPENNIELILGSFEENKEEIIFVGNWDRSAFGREMRKRYGTSETVHLLDPIYDIAKLHELRNGCKFYVHGHAAGGTNPSLVEMMFFPRPIVAYDCIYNRETMEGLGYYFSNKESLSKILKQPSLYADPKVRQIAKSRYSWVVIKRKYEELLSDL